ncbi:MAG: Gldg family protein, partial [Candidatus Thiodiazotropha sp.]
QTDPTLEQEANEKYAIKPVPFQFASKYQSSVVNSYFNILVKYGDQYQVLGFRDLIDVKVRSETDLKVNLRNPEYDITQAIKKDLYAYQGAGELFANINHPVAFKGYISPSAKLPKILQPFRKDLDEVLADLQKRADGKLSVDIVDPEAGGGALAKQLESDYGFSPMTASLFDANTFWFYMTLVGDGRTVQVPLPQTFDKSTLEHSLQAGLKRFSHGFLKTVALVAPKSQPSMPQLGMAGGGERFTQLHDKLAEEHNVIETDLSSGQVPDEADIVVLASPQKLDDRQLFALDQFMMRGGTVIAATSPFDINTHGALSARKNASGLDKWLAHFGITQEQKMVLDPQNAAFPIPVDRDIGGFTVRETQLVDYPYFVDIRGKGMPQQGGITSGLNQVTMTWASPIDIDQTKSDGHKVTRLLESSDQSWTSGSTDIQPDFRANGKLGFPEGKTHAPQLLAVSVEGRFDSYFKGKPSPLAVAQEKSDPKQDAAAGNRADDGKSAKDKKPETPVITRVIERSPESARLILFSSNSFLSDSMLNLATAGLGTRYLKPVQLVENAVDWSLEDRGLLAIRGRAEFSRTLDPLDRNSQVFWEYLNYGLALFGLFVVWLIRRQIDQRSRQRYTTILGAA